MAGFKHKNLTPELRLVPGIRRSFPAIFSLLSGVAAGLQAQTLTDIGSAAADADLRPVRRCS
jgi:hypothetical protein